jgi:hypothetical protein
VRPPASALKYYLRLTLVTPLVLLALLLQTVWSLSREAYLCSLLIYRDELKPLYSSYAYLWTRESCRRASTLARGASPWSKQG